MQEDKIVIIEPIFSQQPFRIGWFVKNTDKMVFYKRFNHDPLTDSLERVMLSSVICIVDKDKLPEFKSHQEAYKQLYQDSQDKLKKVKEDFINQYKGQGL